MEFVNGENALADILEDIDGVTEVYFRTPEFSISDDDQYLAHVPFIVVSKVDGSANKAGWEQTEIIEVASFAETRAQAMEMSKSVRAVLVRPTGARTSAGFLDSVSETSSPQQVPYEQDDARRDVSNWAVVSRIQ